MMGEEKRCFIHIDMDDDQWVLPRQLNKSYTVEESENYIQGVDRIAEILKGLPFTLFLIGRDMQVKKKVERIRELMLYCPHVEIANHSFSHLNEMSRLSLNELNGEIMESDRVLRESLSLEKIYGFRSPGFAYSENMINALKANGYLYDSSVLPTFFGPMLRTLNWMINKVPGYDNFGRFQNGFLPNRPYLLDEQIPFYEVPVSVCPGLRTPVHYSIVRKKKYYTALRGLLDNIPTLTFLFHLKDFIGGDQKEMKEIVALITAGRDVILSKDFCLK